ncbi:MAG TPA: citrate synthase [Candidatus Hydrogenedentes bacterium]|nr:citrate synthase [Candidatus Hydrogenedentota bacterium]
MGDAKLTLNGQDFQLPTFEGSEGEVAIDVGSLRGQTKAITFDPGYGNTGSCKSAITFINGEKGILQHRGYAIDDLAHHASFPAVSYLVIHGELPTEAQLKEFEGGIAEHSKLPQAISDLITTFPKDAHPMSVLSSMTAALASVYSDYDDDTAEETNVLRMLGHVRKIATEFYRHTQDRTPVTLDPKISYCGNFLNGMFAEADGSYTISEKRERALNMLMIVHADHEQNCSTSTVRMVGSSQTCMFASMSAGISALWGPLHGGANQAVLEMLEAINDDGGDYKKYMEMAKDKDSGFRLMGFGHRVYKNFDPRATILKEACDDVLAELGVTDPLLDIAKNLEKIALEDDYFVKRSLYPNVDFYSGIIYRAMGIPVNMFTVLFAIGRMPGWLAHWLEMREEGSKIHRPRQIYTGQTHREFPK